MFNLIVCDVSFISLMKALPKAIELAPPGTDLLALIKPQFEVGPQNVGKGGIVSDPVLQKQACSDVEAWLRDTIRWTIHGFTPSPIEGGDGNREFFVHAVKP
jgi:23S rRNA (cytidine1920-2'-O)/16S rRNA (cytidine1409-2'-O)-methyltransferase